MPKDIYASLKQGLVGCWIPSISGSGLTLPDLSQYGNHGSLVGMDASDWVSSGSGRALDFDGSNDYVNVADANALSPTGAISISFWAKPAALPAASNGSRMWAVTKGNTSNFEYECSINSFSTSFGKWNCAYYDLTAGSVNARATTADAIAGSWQHVCWTANRNNDLPDIYFNGELSNGATIAIGTPTPGNGTAPLQIGRRANASDVTFNGQLDDLRLYSRILTPSEIRLLSSDRGIGFRPSKRLSNFSTRYAYKPPKPRSYGVIRNRDADTSSLKNGLVAAWCPSISGQGNVLPDLIGGNHGTLTNMDASDWVSSGEGRALDFDGVNDYVSCSKVPFTGTGNFSISLWLSQATIRSEDHAIKFGTATLNNAIGIFNSTGNNLAFGLHANNASEAQLTANLTAGVFYHVVGTCQPTRREIWLNGVLGGTSTTTANYNITSTFCNIGAAQSVLVPWNGRLDDIRIYNRILTESEIKLLASKRGIGLEPRKPKITFTDLGVKKQFSQIRVKDSDTSTLRQGLVGAWCPSLPNGGSGNMLPDVSGYGNHGSLVNMSPDDWVSSQYGRALDFDGTDQGVNIGNAKPGFQFDNTSYFTASLWFYNETQLGSASFPGVFIQQASSNRFAWGIGIDKTTNAITFAISKSGVGSDGITVASSVGNWYHAALVFKSTTFEAWVNGVFKSSANYTRGTVSSADGLLYIGRDSGASNRGTNCLADDARIYNRALTESEIRLLASRPGIGLQNPQDDYIYYPFPSGSRRRRLLTGMP